MTLTGASGDHLRIVAIIHARTASNLPANELLGGVAGRSPLWHLVGRLKRAQLIEEIALTTSTSPRDDVIAAFGRENGLAVIRGPEDDVLAGFARAAELLDADIIVSVSAEVPNIDAGLVDHLVVSLLEQNGDYVLLEEEGGTTHEGVEPFTRRALDKLMMDARHDILAREQVTGYLKQHPNFVRIVRAPAYRPGSTGHDLAVASIENDASGGTAYRQMTARGASLSSLREMVEVEPDQRRPDSPAKQRPLSARAGLALVYCNAGGKFGYGRLKRMVALAKNLRDDKGIVATFVVSGGGEVLKLVRDCGFNVSLLADERRCEVLDAMIASQRPELLICDLCEGLSGKEFARLAARVAIAAVIDDSSERRLAADLAYYPPTPQAAALDWANSQCVTRIGWEWSLLGVGVTAPTRRLNMPRPTLLVTMGASNSHALTLRAARALTRLDPVFRARFVIGPGMRDRTRNARSIVTLATHFETLEGADDLATEYAASDLALVSFGLTAYELAAYGVPALYLCLNENHAKSACAFEDAGLRPVVGIGAACERCGNCTGDLVIAHRFAAPPRNARSRIGDHRRPGRRPDCRRSCARARTRKNAEPGGPLRQTSGRLSFPYPRQTAHRNLSPILQCWTGWPERGARDICSICDIAKPPSLRARRPISDRYQWQHGQRANWRRRTRRSRQSFGSRSHWQLCRHSTRS